MDIVPLAMKGVPREREPVEGFIRHADPGRIRPRVAFRADGQAGGGAGDARDQGFAPSPGFDQGCLPVGGRGQARVMAFLAARPARASWAASHTPKPALVSASRLDAGRCAAGSRRAPRHRAPAKIPPPGRGPVPTGQCHHQRVGDLPCGRQQISGPLSQLPDAVQHDAQIEPPAHHLIVALLVTIR